MVATDPSSKETYGVTPWCFGGAEDRWRAPAAVGVLEVSMSSLRCGFTASAGLLEVVLGDEVLPPQHTVSILMEQLWQNPPKPVQSGVPVSLSCVGGNDGDEGLCRAHPVPAG